MAIRIHKSTTRTEDVDKRHASIVRKYAHIKSESRKGVEYVVVKIRIIKNNTYKYRCNCPDHMFRNRDCKHIWQFKEREKRL